MHAPPCHLHAIQAEICQNRPYNGKEREEPTRSEKAALIASPCTKTIHSRHDGQRRLLCLRRSHPKLIMVVDQRKSDWHQRASTKATAIDYNKRNHTHATRYHTSAVRRGLCEKLAWVKMCFWGWREMFVLTCSREGCVQSGNHCVASMLRCFCAMCAAVGGGDVASALVTTADSNLSGASGPALVRCSDPCSSSACRRGRRMGPTDPMRAPDDLSCYTVQHCEE